MDSEASSSKRVDHAALRTNQAFIVVLLILGFILGNAVLVGFVGTVMLLGTAMPRLALFQQVYHRLLRPSGLVTPRVLEDDPAPHRFAQGFGGTVVMLALSGMLLGWPQLGWSLVWLVVALAALNLSLGFCAGCFLYYQLRRLGVPGFRLNPTDT